MRRIVYLLLFIAALYGFVVLYGESTTKYVCDGTIKTDSRQEQGKLFMSFSEYRFFVRLWSESRGNVRAEIPNGPADYFGHLARFGDVYYIHQTKDGMADGRFSTLSQSLKLSLSGRWFDGMCTKF